MIPKRIPGEIPETKRIKIEQRNVEAAMKEAMRERLKLHAKALRFQDWKLLRKLLKSETMMKSTPAAMILRALASRF